MHWLTRTIPRGPALGRAVVAIGREGEIQCMAALTTKILPTKVPHPLHFTQFVTGACNSVLVAFGVMCI